MPGNVWRSIGRKLTLATHEGHLAVVDGRLEDAARAFQEAANASRNPGAGFLNASVLLRAASALAGGWKARGDLDKAIAVLLDATRTSRQWREAALDFHWGGVALWIHVRNELAELYYAQGRRREAEAVDKELRALLAVANPTIRCWSSSTRAHTADRRRRP
jgi:tetratricopeptide (TPR) repeat protein